MSSTMRWRRGVIGGVSSSCVDSFRTKRDDQGVLATPLMEESLWSRQTPEARRAQRWRGWERRKAFYPNVVSGFVQELFSVPLRDAVLLLPYALHGAIINGLVHSISLAIHRSMCCQPS